MKKIILFFLLCAPFVSNAQLYEEYTKMVSEQNPKYSQYESLVFKATGYIFSHPASRSSKEFISAVNIVSFWMNKDTGVGIPVGGKFYKSLTNNDGQQFFYTVAMIHYGLDQKINHNRILTCIPVEGEKYNEREDVKEVQFEGAKIVLKYIGNKENNVSMTSKTKKYYKAFKKNKLKELFINNF